MDSRALPMTDGNMALLAYAVLALPFLSFLVNGLWLARKNWKASAWTAAALMGATLLAAAALALGYRNDVLAHPDLFPGRTALAWEHAWMSFDIGSGIVPVAKVGFYLDPISVMMVLVISFISFLVHVYSIGYMDGEKGAGRFFPLLSFFTFTMLGLVVSSNLVQTFFFWELVGTASYLLIGFWYTKPSAVAASKKAFILTRLADAFFLMGMIVVGLTAGSFDFIAVNGTAAAIALDHTVRIGLLGCNLLTLGTLFIYMGAWGKSAMFPFHVWLPDAMEGPTPVSSLIHSATMVVAGIYLTARLFPLFSAAEYTLRVVEFSGAFTAVFAAVIACTQTDLKRILAFSTLSQLGMMMFALGTGFTGSMFHVFTHAFFKCLLFLSAGVVIHAIHSNDIRDAGGLRKILPRTYWSTLIACLAIAGVVPFSGFFSKEEILHTAFTNGHYGVFLAGLLTSGLTAFYMSRYFFLVFHGAERKNGSDGHADADGHSHAHAAAPAAPATSATKVAKEGLLMTLPILILAVPSACIGWLTKDFFQRTVLPWSAHAAAGSAEALETAGHGGAAWLPIVASLLAATGVGLAWYLYGMKRIGAGYPEKGQPAWHKVVYDKFYIDEIYLFITKRVGARLIVTPIAWVERTIVNGIFDWVTAVIRRFAFLQGFLQSGQVQFYIATALAGLLIIAWYGGIRFR
jgi:NADH-quinone oxidoreductase subunit L